MNQPGQNSNYNMCKASASTFDKSATGSTRRDLLSPINTGRKMGSPLNDAPVLRDSDIAPKLDNEGFGSTTTDNIHHISPAFNMRSQDRFLTNSRRHSARGMQAAHTIGPSRSIPTRGMTSQHPYARPQLNNVQSQSRLRAQRDLSRRTPARDMSMQEATNTYTLPRSQPIIVQPEAQRDLSYGEMSAFSQMAPGPSSVSPFNSTEIGVPGGASPLATTSQEPGLSDATPAPVNIEPARPVHHTLDSSRIDPAGPTAHPDPNWRAPGPQQWDEILHDYTLLQYLSDAIIKDLLKHCDRLVSSGVQDPANPTGPAVVEGGPYTVLDAQAVWNYCTAYTKRRQQHRNNSAASRSRNNKAAQLKHWKALALAAGAPDRDFVFDINDEGNAPGAPPTLLAAATQAALDEMKSSWISTAGIGDQVPAATFHAPDFVPSPAPQPLDQSQIQQQVYGQAQVVATPPRDDLALPVRNHVHSTTMAPQVAAAVIPASGLSTYTTASPLMAAPPSSIPSTAMGIQQSNEAYERFKLDAIPLDEDLLMELNAVANNQNAYDGDFDFGVGSF